MNLKNKEDRTDLWLILAFLLGVLFLCLTACGSNTNSTETPRHWFKKHLICINNECDTAKDYTLNTGDYTNIKYIKLDNTEVFVFKRDSMKITITELDEK